MKSLLPTLLLLSSFASAANADNGCSLEVQHAVQLEADKLGINFVAEMPDTSEIDGGRLVTLLVPVRNAHGVVVATFSAMIGETCQVMSVSRQD